jgi:uncharacterized membrane protein YhaH (DUF805 family)
MRGQVTALAPDGSYGQIQAEDQQYYSYWTSEVRNGPVTVGQAVEFRLQEGQPVEIFVAGVPRPPSAPPPARAATGYAQMQPATYAGAGTGAPVNYALSGSGFPPFDYWKTLFLSPNGRISRRQFWLHGVVTMIVVSIVLGWIPIINVLLMFATFWASICLSFKRFHDVGYPGWWSLILSVLLFLAPLLMVGSYFNNSTAMWSLGTMLYAGGVILFIVQLIFVYLRKGNDGTNRYGPDPLTTPYR